VIASVAASYYFISHQPHYYIFSSLVLLSSSFFCDILSFFFFVLLRHRFAAASATFNNIELHKGISAYEITRPDPHNPIRLKIKTSPARRPYNENAILATAKRKNDP
jgi:hypothetical protein